MAKLAAALHHPLATGARSRTICAALLAAVVAACSSRSLRYDESGGSAGAGGSGGGGVGGGGAGGAGGASGFCTTTVATLCADFEFAGFTKLLVNGSPADFAPPLTKNGGKVTVTGGLNSATAALLSSPALALGEPESHAELRALAPSGGAMLEYEVALRIDVADVEAPDHAGVAVGGIELGSGANPYKAHIYLDPALTDGKVPVYFAEVGVGVLGGAGYEFRPVYPTQAVLINSGDWVRLFLSLELPVAPSNPGTATLEFQPSGQARALVLSTTIKPSDLGAPTMNLALIAVAPFAAQGAWSIAFDDAVLRVK